MANATAASIAHNNSGATANNLPTQPPNVPTITVPSQQQNGVGANNSAVGQNGTLSSTHVILPTKTTNQLPSINAALPTIPLQFVDTTNYLPKQPMILPDLLTCKQDSLIAPGGPVVRNGSNDDGGSTGGTNSGSSGTSSPSPMLGGGGAGSVTSNVENEDVMWSSGVNGPAVVVEA
ncbi:MAG: hypothetical protein AAF432_15130, partial [Planctomycetota bacterium]